MKTIPFVDVIYFVLLFLCFGICLLNRQKLFKIRYVIALLGVMILVQVYAEYLNLRNINNLYLYHILTPVEYTVLVVIFAYNIHSGFIKRLLLYSIPVFVLLAFVFYKTEGAKASNDYASALEGIVLTLTALTSLREMMMYATQIRINKSPFFWFATGTLFYSVGNLLILGMLNYLIIKDLSVARVLYQISYIFSYQFFILLIIASFMSEKAKT